MPTVVIEVTPVKVLGQKTDSHFLLRYPDCHHQSHPLFLFQSQSIFALDLLITAVAVLDLGV